MKTKIVLFLLIFTFFSLSFSQDKKLEKFFVKTEKTFGQNKTLYGLNDLSGKVILDCQYQTICSFEKGIAKVKQKNLWGYIDSTGSFLVKPKFSAVSSFNNKNALVRTVDNNLVIINNKGNELGKFIVFPNLKDKYEIDLPEPKDGELFYKYISRALIDSTNQKYNLNNCSDSEHSGGILYRKLKFGIIYESEFGWEWSNQRYRIPNFTMEKAISLIKRLTENTDYKMSKRENIVYFLSKEGWMEHFEIEEISPRIIEIRFIASS